MKSIATALVTSIALSVTARAISISIDYMDSSDPFFTSEAQMTLSKAAADVSFAITTSLSALSQDVYTGMDGGSSANVDWDLTYWNPLNEASTVTQNTFSFAANEIVIKVGSRSIGGNTLGVGGPGGASIGLGGGIASDETFARAVDAMEASSNAGMGRGGPILSTLSGTLGSEHFNLSFGYALSSLAFDNDPETLWNFSFANLPATGQSDFYSVAVHEILHSLGIGGGETWTQNVSGTNWTGPAVAKLLDSGVDVLESDGSHIKSGLLGFAIINGEQTNIQQEVAMDPTLTLGTRKYLTDVDLAFLSDMGWAVIPEPSHATLTALSLLALILRRKR